VRFLPGILLIVLAVYCLVEVAQSSPSEVRQMPRGLWVLAVLIPLAGPVCWLVFGRPNGTAPAPRPVRHRPTPLAPDDDPDFLRNLDKRRPGSDA
jgi:Phospholipase_D-nuclease N-terminal